MTSQCRTERVDGEGGSSLSWTIQVERLGGEGNSREYGLSMEPESMNSHVRGNPNWDFVLIGEWEKADFSRVLRAFADLVDEID